MIWGDAYFTLSISEADSVECQNTEAGFSVKIVNDLKSDSSLPKKVLYLL